MVDRRGGEGCVLLAFRSTKRPERLAQALGLGEPGLQSKLVVCCFQGAEGADQAACQLCGYGGQPGSIRAD